jgi:hypothetical protein
MTDIFIAPASRPVFAGITAPFGFRVSAFFRPSDFGFWWRTAHPGSTAVRPIEGTLKTELDPSQDDAFIACRQRARRFAAAVEMG